MNSAILERAGTMNVPYAEKWQKETDKLRQIALDCGLTEELKWSKPCFTFLGKNVAIVIPLKESCAFSFFKGPPLKDLKHILKRVGQYSQAGRWIKFTSVREIAALRSTLKDYLYEAIELEEAGKKLESKKPSEYPIPEELRKRLEDNAALRSAFAALTPGRRKSYIFHVSSAKQAKTRAARAETCVPMILSGRGFHESVRCGPGKTERRKKGDRPLCPRRPFAKVINAWVGDREVCPLFPPPRNRRKRERRGRKSAYR
jgi:uncharacterized protein YdeI (YjbR/CyaY-like superfamily)